MKEKQTSKQSLTVWLTIIVVVNFIYLVAAAIVPSWFDFFVTLILLLPTFMSFYRYRPFYKKVVSKVFLGTILAWILTAVWISYVPLVSYGVIAGLAPIGVYLLVFIHKEHPSLADEYVREKM